MPMRGFTNHAAQPNHVFNNSHWSGLVLLILFKKFKHNLLNCSRNIRPNNRLIYNEKKNFLAVKKFGFAADEDFSCRNCCHWKIYKLFKFLRKCFRYKMTESD
ncbi:hypothetical protein KQX54_009056 [Cotesia glomerata]|uniref:Uncharacterized protein n=1 Tax=Cotesia glomerata TaxID=32391 RepID=A0AAV7HQH1_COTGL|nr:hypothetical protein KQX54_009056 [Cotesia glomerata]